MTGFEFTLILPEEMPSILAILGELLCLKLHEIEVQLGRIQPKNVRDILRHLALARPSLLRQSATPWLFICVSRNDSQTCARCTQAHLHMFSGSTPGEAPVKLHCVNPLGCRCVVIPIIGQQPVVERLRAQLSSQQGLLQLSEQDLHGLIYQGGNISEQDQLAYRVLCAMLDEETNPRAARETYRQALAATPKGSNALLQAAVYIRLSELLERSGDFEKALQVTRSFLKTYTEKDWQRALDKPQYDRFKTRKTRLLRRLLITPSASESRW